MSRNLLSKECVHCGDSVKITSPIRPITKEQAGVYYDEFEGMLVASAMCPSCFAEYLAWIDTTTCVNPIHRAHGERAEWGSVLDLSYLRSFDDEPHPGDLPTYEIQTIITRHRIGLYSKETT
jgi:hypothetical protein